jgi:hypothetical protein
MSVVVGVLTIDLKANTASFSQSMDKMSSLSAKTANDIKRSLDRIAVAGIAMAGAIATGTIAAINGALETADAMGKMATAAGTTAETMSVLSYAAKLTGVATETVTKGLERLSVSALKAQNGNSQLEKIFGKLGVTVADSKGHLQDSGVMMEQVAIKVAKMGDGAGKTALVMALFGKGGAALIPMLNKLGKEQAAVNEEAHRFGLVIGTSTAQVSAEAKERIEELHMVLKGMGFSLLSAVLPALSDFIGKLQSVATNMNLPDLAAQFGQKVTGAIHLLGDALDFATQHAHGLTKALETLAGLKIAAIAIPVIGDLAGGGIEKVGAGISKLVISGLGLSKVIPVLAEFGAWLKYTASFVGLLAAEEGIGAAATYVFGGALAAIGGPITLAIGALVGLGVAIYKFRDATFSLGGSVYQLRDIWNAAWIAMGWAVDGTVKFFKGQMDEIKALWSGVVRWITQNPLVQAVDLKGANDRLDGYVGNFVNKAIERLKGANDRLNKALTPKFVIGALNEAKKQRVAKDTKPASPLSTVKPPPGLPPPDTSGLGKQKESPVGKLLANLQEKLDESKQTLAAAGLEEEAQRKVAAANKASNEIMKLGEEIAKQTGAKTKDYASLVDQATQSLIREKNAQISDNEAKTTLLNLLGTTSRASALSIAQSGLMVQAMDKGSDAVLRQTAVTQAWNELRAKGGSLAQILTRSQEIYAESVAKESQSIQGNIINLQQELAARKIVNDAILGSLAAQDDAALAAKLYALDVQIAGAASGGLKDQLLAQRAAMVALNEEEKRASDLQNARALKSPAEQYALEQEKLADTVAALKQVQGGVISYGQSLQIAMKEQENFNHLIDETVKSLLAEGTAADGVNAFFLDMQKSAITAGQVIYDALHSAFTKLSDNLTQLVTGGKTSFAQMFQDIGRQMVNQTIQKGMQTGLSALGKAFPSLSGPLGNLSNAMKGKPDGSQNNPLWVQMAAGGGMGGTGGGSQSNPLSVALGAASGIGGVKGGALGIGTGVMGTGVTSPGGDALGLGGSHGIPGLPSIDAITGIGPDQNDGGGGGGGGTPITGIGSSVGDAITGIGPDQNDGGGDSSGDGGAGIGGGSGGGGGVTGIGNGLLSMISGIFGGKQTSSKPDGSQGNPFWVKSAGGSSGGGGSFLQALGGGGSTGGSGGGSGSSGGFDLSSLFGDSGGGGADMAAVAAAGGGPISGPGTGTSDSIPAKLSNGEFVVRAAPAAKFKGLLNHINKGGKVGKAPGFAAGGWVGYADGGTVTAPSSAYTMGGTTSTMAAASGQIAGNTAARRGQGSPGNTAYYTIDARGTDPVLTEQRTRAALIAVHGSAVSNAVQVNAERIKRTPQR